MRSHSIITAGMLLGAALTSDPALAQPRAQTHRVDVAPVDQAIGDQDPLAQSQRWVDPGNTALSGDARLYDRFAPVHWRPGDPAPILPGLTGSRRYSLVGQGYEARFNRPDYLVARRGSNGKPVAKLNRAPGEAGQAILITPADTVFELIPPDRRNGAPRYDPYAAHPDDPRLDGRVDGRMRNPFNGKLLKPVQRRLVTKQHTRLDDPDTRRDPRAVPAPANTSLPAPAAPSPNALSAIVSPDAIAETPAR